MSCDPTRTQDIRKEDLAEDVMGPRSPADNAGPQEREDKLHSSKQDVEASESHHTSEAKAPLYS